MGIGVTERLRPVDPVERAPIGFQVGIALALPVLFVIVYWGADWLVTIQGRDGHATLVFDWERNIPFAPIMIVPYLSLDAIFLITVFLSGSRQELRVLVRRMVFVILVSGVCFSLFPTKIVTERPVFSGFLGWAFAVLSNVDSRNNALPSLHVAITTVLWADLARHGRWPLRWAVHTAFALVVGSTLLTRQHHVLDVAAGLGLGTISLIAWRLPDRQRLRSDFLPKEEKKNARPE